MTSTADEALQNAETYARHGLFARLADSHWRLSTDDSESKAGKLVLDSGLPAKVKRGPLGLEEDEVFIGDRAHARDFESTSQ